MFIVRLNREKERQQFKYQLDCLRNTWTKLDMMCGEIKKGEILFPFLQLMKLKIKEVEKALG